MPKAFPCGLLAVLALATTSSSAEPTPQAVDQLRPSHDRPYFMPQAERQRIQGLIRSQPWAKAEYERIQQAAEQGDGFWAAFLYALDNKSEYLPTAREYLAKQLGPGQWAVRTYGEHLADPDHFKGGQPHLADVYYNLSYQPFVVYDWLYRGLTPQERGQAERGIQTLARYRMRSMDRWTQTPNLVFKPTFMVAMAGLSVQDPEMLQWGFLRTQPHGQRLGGYFQVIDYVMRHGGVWHEAPIYPIAHEDLWCMSIMSRYGQLYDGRDWFALTAPSGGSAKGLMNYFIDSAYPIEQTGYGRGQVRVATYGDGATSPGGDLFLANPAGKGLNAEKAMIAAFAASSDERCAALIGLIQDYTPNLWDRRPLPARVEMPAAQSKIWPGYGLAMLRNDESPGYWTNSQAIAVFQIMSQGYGHDHRDKFGIMLHGASRLLYPDYNAIQYESSAIGWTRHSCSHNTLLVDEQDTANAQPTAIRHEFSPEVKYLATSAEGVFEGVEQTRALLLTDEYLLDVFHATSQLPHDYDYLLHCLGKGRAVGGSYRPAGNIIGRYWVIEDKQAMTTDQPWAFEFVQQDPAGSRGGNYGKPWYDHAAHVRVSMAGEPGTVVVQGRWGEAYAKLIKKGELDDLASLCVRREGVPQTVFIATHEPYANGERPAIRGVTKLAQSEAAALVRVDADTFTDYAAVSFGPQDDDAAHLLGDGNVCLQFHDYAYVRVSKAGAATVRGKVVGLRLPGVKGTVTVNGQRVTSGQPGKDFVYFPAVKTPAVSVPPACPLDVAVSPKELRVWTRDRKIVELTIRNTLKEPVAGHVEFELPHGFSAQPTQPDFGPLDPGKAVALPIEFTISDPQTGKQTLAYRVVYRQGETSEDVRATAAPLVAYAGPTIEQQFQFPKQPVYRAVTSNYSAKMRMADGAFVYLADDTDRARIDGDLLFHLCAGEGDERIEVLGGQPQQLGVWPGNQPANLVAEAFGRTENRSARCRWQAIFSVNRIVFRMDQGWTQFDKGHFVLPGNWKCSGQPRWSRVIATDQKGQEREARPGEGLTVPAALLDFPDGDYDLALQFQPPQQVTFRGAGVEFAIGSFNNDQWHLGFCKAEEFDAWRGR